MKYARWVRTIALITAAVLSVVGEVRSESSHRGTPATTVTAAAATSTPAPCTRRL